MYYFCIEGINLYRWKNLYRQLKSETGEYFEKYDDYEMEIQGRFLLAHFHVSWNLL